LLAAACETVPPAAPTAVLPEPVSAEISVPIAATRFAIDPQGSEVRLLVYRAGPLARFGHNHVIVGRVHGEIRAGNAGAASGFRLEIPVDSFGVDPPAARAEEGADFAAEVSEQARNGTRENMLGASVLDAADHPRIAIASIALVGPDWNPTVTARVTLRGATRDLRFPAAVFRDGARLTVIANFRINQSDFGIEPLALLGGGLRVHDPIDIRVRLVGLMR
jgi:polyisoprenoid-binding protein YceI